jgi:hypothetical protein
MKSVKLSRILILHLVASIFYVANATAADGPALELEQQPDPPDLPNSISGTRRARDLIQDYISARKDIQEGPFKTPDGRSAVVWTAVAPIDAPTGSPGFGLARWTAFQKAMLDVKAECAKFQAAQIRSEVQAIYAKPDAKRAEEDAERLRREGLSAEGAIKVAAAIHNDNVARSESATLATASLYTQKIITNKLEADLRSKGIDPNQPVEQAKIGAVLNSAKFAQAVGVEAVAKCSGIQALVTVENTPPNRKGEIGVVAIWTEKLHAIASSFGTGNWKLLPQGEPGLKLADHLPKTNTGYLATFGTQLVRDESGQYVLLAFAQASPDSDSSREIDFAYRRADTLASGLIRQFIGEQVMLSEDLMAADEATEYRDAAESYSNNSSYESKIRAVAERQKVSGMTTVARRETRHPAANTPVVMVVKALMGSSIESAARMTEVQSKPAPSGGTNSGTSGAGATEAPRKATGSFSATGSGGKDF